MRTSFSISPSMSRLTGIPVQLATTSATSSADTSSLSIGEPACSSASRSLAIASSFSRRGNSP